jgi:methionyl-tRNA formyltransferase
MILTLQPERIKDGYEEIIDLYPDLIITCAYGQILPKNYLMRQDLVVLMYMHHYYLN